MSAPSRTGLGSTRAVLLAFGLLLAGCDSSRTDPLNDPPSAPPVTADGGRDLPAGDRQTAFRVRAEAGTGLNADGGWAAGVNEPARVVADRPFRLRFEVEAGEAAGARSFRFQVRRSEGAWVDLPAEDFPYPQKLVELPMGRTPDGVWAVEHGDATALQPDATGTLRLDADDGPLRAFVEPDIHWTPSEFALIFRLDTAPEAGTDVVFEATADGRRSRLRLRPGHVQLVRSDGDDATVVAERALLGAIDGWQELKIALDATTAAVELDDTLLFEAPRLPDARPRLGLDHPPGLAATLREVVIEGTSSSPRTSIIGTDVYAHGAATADLLEGSDRPFAGGAGVDFAPRTPDWSADGGHGEWSVPLVIRRFADEAAMNEAGDRFDYRLVDADGTPVPAGVTASVTLTVPDGHLGGTFVETPMRLGPWQAADGTLYFIIEPAETWNRPMMVASTDGGRSWREIDGANRPWTGDLEGLATAFVDGRIHVLHQISEAVVYHAFDTADRVGGPGRWVIRDEPVATMPAPPTQVVDVAVRADGALVTVYGAGTGLRLRIRSADGDWGPETPIEEAADIVLSGPTMATGAGDVVHLAYTAGDGSARYRRLESDGALGAPVRVTDDLATGDVDVGALLPLQIVDGTVALVYRNTDGHLHERRLEEGGRWSEAVRVAPQVVVQNAVDSDQVGADAIVDGDTLHVLFIDAATGHLMHVAGDDGEWSAPDPVVIDANVQWVRGQVVETPDGQHVYGFVFDAGSNGGSGMNRYAELPLR